MQVFKGKILFCLAANIHVRCWLLDPIAKLRKAIISFVMSFCPSAWNSSTSKSDFDKIWYLGSFRKSVEKIQVSLKSGKNNEYFTWRRFDIYGNISLNSS